MKLEHVNEERFAKNLSRAIQIATISHEDEADTDWTKFKEIPDFLKGSIPKDLLYLRSLKKSDAPG